ncbi:MAG: ribosome maturation factor RimP [Acidobacteria bacterium]|nr:ribosome maturation factor RimP [Acidobacteriota bacterium]
MARAENEAIATRVAEITGRVGRPKEIEAVDVELLGGGHARVLRIYIDKPGGVTHADCEYISQHVGTILDVEDVIPGGSYTLEVSSPGVERKLKRPADFQRFVGKKARVVLREPVENQRHWEGRLADFADGWITLEAETGKSVQFPVEQVAKANLKFEW